MKAGALDRTITIERATEAKDDLGVVTSTWRCLATRHAQLVQSSTAEFMRAFGASTETAIVFRLRFLAGVTLADRVRFDGATFNLVEIKELGRREGLELRCTRTGP